MKKILLTAVITGMVFVTSNVIASKSNTEKIAADAAAVEQKDAATQLKSLSGVVGENDKGLFLETTEGVFSLDGADLKELVGQKVAILGTITGQGDAQHLAVEKVVVTE